MMHRIPSGRRAATGIALVAAIGLAAGAAAGAAQAIPGDCGGDGQVTVDELIIGVDIALGSQPLSSCSSFDTNDDGEVTVDELIVAVHVALVGVTPTPTVTATPTPTEPPPAQQVAFVVVTDFQTGSFATVALDEPRTVTQASRSRVINGDAVARTYGGLVYVINRFGADNIQVLDPARGFATTLQCSTGAGSNPNDIAFLSGTKAYVALYAEAKLLIVNPSARADCSDFVLGHVDLSAYADSDGIPEMNQLAVVGDRLFVSLQKLANFMPTQRGVLAVIDTASDQVVNTIELAGENPFGQTKGLTMFDGELLIGEIGAFGVNDGGIEQINPDNGTSQGFIITEAELGGDLTDFVLVSPELGYAILSKADFSNVLAFNPTTREVTQTLIGSGALADIELDDRGELFVADRDIAKPGIRIFRASDGTQVTSGTLDLGLPPFDIVFVP